MLISPPSLPGAERTGRASGALLLLLGLALAGCAESSPGDSGGDLAVVRLGDPAVRFGSLDDPASSLVPVDYLALGPDGSVWAAQGQDGQVLLLSPDGTPRRRIGGLGEGPEEFGGIQGMGWIGDSLWVTDNRNDRVSFIDLGGEIIGSIPRPRADVGDEETASFTGLLAEGALFVGGPSLAVLTDPNAPKAGDDPVFGATRDGESARPIGVRSGTRPQVIVTEMAGGEIQSISIYRQPWSDGSLVGIEPGGGGIAVVDRALPEDGASPTYRVTRIGLQADTAWSTTRGYEPVAADRARQDSLVTQYAENGPAIETIEEALFLPATLPPVSSVFIGVDGRTWVGREGPADADVRQWDVFDPAGRLVAIFAVPLRIRLMAADGSMVWGVETDDLDVPYLVRFDLPGG
jgi:hypothetical protein